LLYISIVINYSLKIFVMTTQKNGATIPTNGKKIETAVVLTPVKSINTETKTGSPSLDDRLHRLNELFELQKKYNRLTASKQKLAEFKMKKGEENISLTIEDNNSRTEFSTSNPEIVAQVMEFVSVKIDEKKKQIEPLLTW
jgi:hypothetical protein